MRKICLPAMLRCLFPKSGKRSRKLDDRGGGGGDLSSKQSVNDEYVGVFRTKSYLEMWDRVHRTLQNSTSSNITRLSSSSSPSLNYPSYVNISENLLDPRQETLNEVIKNEDETNNNVAHLLTDYFEASLEACHICELLLRSIHQTHVEYRKVKKAMTKLSQRVENSIPRRKNNVNYAEIFRELTTYSRRKNPLSIISLVQFRDIRNSYSILFNTLMLRQHKIQRRAKRNKMLKNIAGVGLVVSLSALLIALLAFSFHTMIGIIAVGPVITAFSIKCCKKKMARLFAGSEEVHGGEPLDEAARGIFILINDFGTMGQMVVRLKDDVEHRKAVAELCVRNGRRNKCEVFKGALREFHVHDSNFMKQLEELEEHVYLCMLTINRSRRLVLEEILATHN